MTEVRKYMSMSKYSEYEKYLNNRTKGNYLISCQIVREPVSRKGVKFRVGTTHELEKV